MLRDYRNDMSVERARELFNYDPETGTITNRTNRSRAPAGAQSGYVRPDGYRTIRADHTAYLAHRVAWLLYYGEWPTQHIDHVDQNPSNNVIANLRECDDAENAQNLAPKGYGTSGYLGVTRYHHDPTKWVAKIKKAQKAYNLGIYNCRTAAYVAYCTEKRRIHTFAAGATGGQN